MKIQSTQNPFLLAGFGVFLSVALLSVARAQLATPAPAKPAGPLKVRVMVSENMGGMAPSGAGTATPAPGEAKPAAPAAGTPKPAAAKAALAAADTKTYTRTSSKTFTITVANITAASMDVVVKTDVLAKDEAGKHEIVTEKTLENKLTLPPGKPTTFTTEEVTFTHMMAHRPLAPPKAGGGGVGRNPKVVPIEPASGHAYFGYKVEVLEGNDVVGSAMSENH